MFNPYYNAFPNNNSIYNPVSAGMGYSQLNKQEITEVYGMQGAQTYQMAPNSSVILLDASNPTVYIKRTDGAGSASISAYKLMPFQEENNTSDLEKRVKRLEELINESYTFDASKLKPRESAEQNHGNQNNDGRQKR